jgi:hypothetical protein
MYKKQGNPLQNTIKLLLNSIYGKSILKAMPTDTIVINHNELDRYIIRNYNYIQDISEGSGKIFVKRIKTIDNHYNVPQFGATVLSWSKHLMNKVVCLAEQNDISIYYTDTDSIHIRESDINRLAEVYEEKYHKTLIGSNLTQFHSDFEPIKNKPAYSTLLIALGKKSYLDKLENSDGDVDYHIRMKGIPEQVIINWCKNNETSLEDLYKRLYDGERIIFDLTDGTNCFKRTKTWDQVTLNSFKRAICFKQ